MWQRVVRLLTSGLNMFAFYSNPAALVKNLLLIILIPYLVYIFWGSVILVGLFTLCIYLLIRYFKKSKNPNRL